MVVIKHSHSAANDVSYKNWKRLRRRCSPDCTNSESANTKYTESSIHHWFQSSYPICKVLEAIVEFSGDGMNARFDHAVDNHLELLFSEAEAEPLLKRSDG